MKKRQRPRSPQHGKNRSRPRAWHRGVAAGRIQAVDLSKVEQAEARAARAEQELKPGREEIREHRELWTELQHAAPFVPSWL